MLETDLFESMGRVKAPVESVRDLGGDVMVVRLACEFALAAVTAVYLLATVPRGRSVVVGLFSGLTGGDGLLLTLDKRSKNSFALLKRDTRLADLVKPVA